MGSDVHLIKKYLVCGRVITFEIAADEQLIGCELEYGDPFNLGDFLMGVTWLKWKII